MTDILRNLIGRANDREMGGIVFYHHKTYDDKDHAVREARYNRPRKFARVVKGSGRFKGKWLVFLSHTTN